MDQSTLVGDQVGDGSRFVERFAADGNSIQAAFWVKTAEDGIWYLYIVTELVDQLGPKAAYRAVRASLEKIGESSVSGSEIKVISPNNSIARDVLALVSRHSVRLATRFGPETLGTLDVDQLLVYPPHFFKLTEANPMTTDDIGREILRLMNRGPGLLQSSQIVLKDGTAFAGVPFSLETGIPGTMVARFIAEREPAPRVIRLDEIVAIR